MHLLKKTLGLVKTKEFRVMNTLGERVNWAMKEKKLDRKDLADALGVSTMAIGDLINNKTKKPRNLLELSEILGVDAKWLQSGEGEIPEISTALSTISSNNEENISLVVLDIEASAGDGAVNGDMVQVVKQLQFVPEQFHKYYPGITPANIRIINVKGDSMYPTFNNGDLLFVDISIQAFDGDGIYIFSFDNTIFVKRIQKTGRDYCIISDNEALYKPWFITPNDMPEMHIHGKVKIHQSQKLNFVG